MAATVPHMSMPLDGFVTGPRGDEDVTRLHEWVAGGKPGDERRPPGVNGQIVDEFMATGAVVAGRGTFEPADGWSGDHHDGVPIWVLSRCEPGINVSDWPLVTYVDDAETVMTEAKRAAGDIYQVAS